MSDQFGNTMTKHVVSARIEEVQGSLRVTLTLLLKIKLELRKIDVLKETYPASPEQLLIQITKDEFGEKTQSVVDALRGLLSGDKSAGKFFLREALSAYGALEKLRSDQVEEVLMGVYLVGQVHDL